MEEKFTLSHYSQQLPPAFSLMTYIASNMDLDQTAGHFHTLILGPTLFSTQLVNT